MSDDSPTHEAKSKNNEEPSPAETNGIELVPTFSYSLQHRILNNCVISAILEPNGVQSIVAVTTSNKIIVKNSETALNITETIRCIASVPFGNGYDYLVIGTDAHAICYDVHNNRTVFRNEIPDGVNCFTVGKVADKDIGIYCGGNCCIWGFDKDGNNIYWTVTGDIVTTMCLCDVDNDGEKEIIAGSPDFEIRIFKNDLMRWEMMETDAIICLEGVTENSFAYALSNGTLGVYQNNERKWRIKSKNSISQIYAFPNSSLMTCIWKMGKIDMRSASTGEIRTKDHSLTAQVIASTVTVAPNEDDSEIAVVLADGKVHGYKIGTRYDTVDNTQEQIREYGQKKHNLMMELSNYEAEEQMSEADRLRDHRIPIDTTVNCLYRIDEEDQTLQLVIEASHNIFIRAVVIFAEGLFEGESYMWIPTVDKQGDKVSIPIVPQKDSANDLHIKAFLGHVDAYKLHVFEISRQIPRFARFTPVNASERWTEPTCYVECEMKIKVFRFFEWVRESFVIDENITPYDPESTNVDLRLVGLAPKKGACLAFRFEQKDNKMRICHDCIETAGNLMQNLAEFCGLHLVESYAHFPEDFKEADEILSSIDELTDVRDRLTADLQEEISKVKETLIRAEDLIAVDNISEARKFYRRLKQMDATARQAALLRNNNNEKCIKSLRRLNKIIENASKLRVGEPSRQIITSCRAAIADDNKTIIVKILEFGAAQH